MAEIVAETVADPDLLATDIAAHVIAAAVIAADAMPAVPGLCRADAPLFAWLFVRDEITYIAEEGDQYVRLPARTLADRRADCKSTAVLIASIAAAHGCAVDLVFVRHRGADHLGHVYAVCDGVACDPLEPFGTHPDGAERIAIAIADGIPAVRADRPGRGGCAAGCGC